MFSLPLEIIEKCIEFLPFAERYRCAVILRFHFFRDKTLVQGKGLDHICDKGLLSVLENINAKKNKYKYSNLAVDRASQNGHVYVLQWWKESGLELRYTTNAINHASRNGHVSVLQWWKDNASKQIFKTL